MKFMVTGFLMFSSLAAFSSELNLSNAAEFEFLHCEPMSTQAREKVVHYIVALDNSVPKSLYVSSNASSTKALDLAPLLLAESNLKSTEKDGQDMGFSSATLGLTFSLVIKDTDGQYLEGTISTETQSVPVKCVDVTLE